MVLSFHEVRTHHGCRDFDEEFQCHYWVKGCHFGFGSRRAFNTRPFPPFSFSFLFFFPPNSTKVKARKIRKVSKEPPVSTLSHSPRISPLPLPRSRSTNAWYPRQCRKSCAHSEQASSSSVSRQGSSLPDRFYFQRFRRLVSIWLISGPEVFT